MGLYETQEANYEYRKSMKESYNEGYEAGYEQGKKDAKVEAIPVEWLLCRAEWFNENNLIFVADVIMSTIDGWREEQEEQIVDANTVTVGRRD